MKPILVGLALAFFAGATAAPVAQQPQEQKNEPAHKIYVLTGCLVGSTAPTSPYKLTGAAAVGQAPAEGKAGAGVKDEYELLPISGVVEQGVAREELQKHVGKKVEVTVRPVEVAPAKSSPSAPTAPYKLTGAAAVGQAPAEGTPGAGVKEEYELLPTTGLAEQGLAREELQKHVGKKVEVTVRPVEMAPAKSSPSAATTSTAKPEEPPQRYTVTKIQALATACQ